MTQDPSPHTSDGSIGLAFDTQVSLLSPPGLTEQVRGAGVVLTAPGQHVVDSLRILAQVQQATQNKVVHVFWASLRVKGQN